MKVFLLLLPIVLYAKLFTPIEEVTQYDKDVVALGKALFEDPILSKDRSISCLSCHFQYGADSNPQSFGVGGAKGEFNAPSVFNATFNYFQHWSGDVKDLSDQFDLPITTHNEMAATAQMIEQRLNASSKYKKLFDKAFHKKPSYALAKKAVVAFEETLVTPSKFDRFLRGEVQLSQEESKGFEIFKNYGCATCHNGKNLGGNSIQLFGNIIPKEEKQKFLKVPSLRNVLQTAPYFHDGSQKDITKAIELMAYHNLGTKLSPQQIEYLVKFLQTLTGKEPSTWGHK